MSEGWRCGDQHSGKAPVGWLLIMQYSCRGYVPIWLTGVSKWNFDIKRQTLNIYLVK